ncbi:MAG: ATP-binding protein [Planctomycetia bacterium]
MKPYTPRLIDALIERKLKSAGAVVLRGPRAVGKTTSALHHAASSVRLDQRRDLIDAAELTPATLLAGPVPRLIDEWQLAPSIWNSIRAEIDARGLPGQFILTGSAAPAEDKKRHTGAGRMARLTLRPMTLFEQGRTTGQVRFAELFAKAAKVEGLGGVDIPAYASLIVKGGWPAWHGLDTAVAMEAISDYVDNLADVDLRALEGRSEPVRMAALLKTLARNISTEASLEKLATESEISTGSLSTPTVRKYLDQLTRIYVLEELPAWRPHIRSSIRARVKPKWHFVDPSLATAALGVSPDGLLDGLNAMGLLFESLAVRDLRVYADGIDAGVFHYRDSSDLEIDAIVERRDGAWIGIEVKLGGERAVAEAVANLTKLRARLTAAKLRQLASLCVITGGQASFTRADGIHVIALGHLRP